MSVLPIGGVACWHCGVISPDPPNVCARMFCDGKKCQACLGRMKAERAIDLARRLRLDVTDIRNYELIHEGPYKFRRLKFPPGVHQ